ncbi:MAG: hypothetical protein HPY55_06130 [Firmicutes bacterium]|nr:hypothetical protein [Bacillota bacterium]
MFVSTESAPSQHDRVKVGIGFVTGRRHFPEVLKTYVHSWRHSPCFDKARISLNLFIAYDTDYAGAGPEVFRRIDEEVLDTVDSVTFIDDAAIEREITSLSSQGTFGLDEVKAVFGRGYAKRRNVVLYTALKHRMDYLLFLDDDEYPLAVFKRKDRVFWTWQDTLRSHLESIDAANITHGHHCGYISPIPFFDLKSDSTRKAFRRFIKAVSNDIVSWQVIVKRLNQGGIEYAKSRTLSGGRHVVDEVNGLKFISGSNLGLNLKTFYQDSSLPPFYNPPGGRGEDTFLSACLSDFTVLKVPCYTFHDGFLRYKGLLHGVLPPRLQPVRPDSSVVVQRFHRACIGWIRYKPLLLYITNRHQYQTQIHRIRDNLHASVPVLSSILHHDFSDVIEEFEKYHGLVQTHYRQFMRCQGIWQRMCSHVVAG